MAKKRKTAPAIAPSSAKSTGLYWTADGFFAAEAPGAGAKAETRKALDEHLSQRRDGIPYRGPDGVGTVAWISAVIEKALAECLR